MSGKTPDWPGKVSAEHTDRLAVIYVRQSTMRQVVEHTESLRVQYALVDRAIALGWARDRVKVIDADVGMSGASTAGRAGFAELVSEVGLGHVGIIVGVEVSRLARSGRDWYQLMELCALAATLLADSDGVYDPNCHNDRLLLGLKGTMSEVELHLIKQRMASGRLAKAKRGELFFAVPTGYVLRPSGEVVKDPDEQVRTVIELIFEVFDELGTVNAVLAYLVGHGIRIGVRLREGPDAGELEWRRPSRMTVNNILRHPIYAGIYAHGRRSVDPRRRIAGRPSTGKVSVPMEQWTVVLPDRLPAYITADRWRANLARLQANQATAATPGAVRKGPALLTGLLRCGRCGAKMTVRYTHRDGVVNGYTYVCCRARADYGLPCCQRLSGRCVDTYVSAALLEMLAPAALEVSLAAAAEIEAERGRLEALWVQRLERAAYAADRAARCYRLTEPENRLVSRTLERDWEQALAELERLREDHDRFLAATPPVLSAADRDRIRGLAADVPALWRAVTTTNTDRKQLLRAVIDVVTVTVIGDSEQVTTEIGWAGGHRTSGQLARPVARLEQLSYYPRLVARVLELDDAGLSDTRIADTLNNEGLRPPKRFETFGPQAIRDLVNRLRATTGRSGHRTQRPTPPPGQHTWWMPELAAELAMPPVTVYNWIRRGWVTARQDPDTRRWIITADPTELERLRQLRRLPRGYHVRRRWHNDPAPTQPTDNTAEPQL
ncbi:recombinase family protein [Nocardia amamiensis]|uniref:Recombinase family protein n=1 Tax=Nocardia amamiensis TaxID=404578 RepID=A0ABS0D4F8_9NOCA|nr:recombinase family protein [Nocardia amamiensis]MBF6303018.1 recombinase family protein [Nocardia amamiensis]